MSGPLTGRRVAVTGASRGIGLAIARRLAADGAALALCSRDRASLERTATALRTEQPASTIEIAEADVTDAAALAHFAETAENKLGGIDSLVCNAGIWGPKGALDAIDWDAWMYAFDVNVHGVARTFRAFLPALRRSGRGRIAILSGGGATRPMPNLAAYSATKSAVVRLGETLAEELRAERIPVNMIAPGAVNTTMLDELLAAGPNLIGAKQYADALAQRENGGAPPERGAALASFLLSDRAAGITGKLISAVWDPWEQLDTHAEDLARTDVYTLRRIVPQERGLSWG
jgi:NAD(P)-dependent dehydrogenase (short-subunit alcohol dehydrogenase family)